MSLLLLFRQPTGATTVSGSFVADAVLQKTASATFVADSVILKTASGSFTSDAIILKSISGSFAADAIIKKTVSSSVTSDSVLFKTVSGTYTADTVLFNTASGTFTADAVLNTTSSVAFTADAYIDVVSRPVWTTPGNMVAVNDLTPTLAFNMPEYAFGDMLFMIELDTVNTFNSGNLRIHLSYPTATGWEYWNGSTWAQMDVPVSSTLVGIEARYTLQTSLASGTWFRRVTAGVV
jgi:hypothetical protein